MLNLTLNALEATPRGGEVRVRWSAAEGGCVVIVEDTGGHSETASSPVTKHSTGSPGSELAFARSPQKVKERPTTDAFPSKSVTVRRSVSWLPAPS